MLDRNPETRIKTDEILNDRWFEVVKAKTSAGSSKKSGSKGNKTPRSTNENTVISLDHSPMMSSSLLVDNLNNTSSSNKFNEASRIKKNYKATNVL